MHQPVTAYSIYLAYVDEYLRELGEDSDFVFRAAGIDNIQSLKNNNRIPMEIMARVYGRVYANPRLGGFFARLGERIPLTAHGKLGVAFLVSPDIRSVLLMLQRFTALALPVVKISLEENREEAVLRIEASVTCPNFKAALVESITTHLVSSLCTLSASDCLPLSIKFEHRAPQHADQFNAYSKGAVGFSARRNNLVYPVSVLTQRVRTANRLNQDLLVQQCAEELEQVQRTAAMADRVSSLLRQHLVHQPNIVFVASRLSMSERSLRRRLEEEGHSFRELLKQVRHETACNYLRDSSLPIEKISQLLGYSETASFSQAFRAIAGMPPRQWRAQAA